MQNETFITTTYEYGQFSQVEVTRTCVDFHKKISTPLFSHTCTHRWNRLVFTQCYNSTGQDWRQFKQISSFKGTNFGGFLRLQLVLWAVLHTLINTMCESKYARLRIGPTSWLYIFVFTNTPSNIMSLSQCQSWMNGVLSIIEKDKFQTKQNPASFMKTVDLDSCRLSVSRYRRRSPVKTLPYVSTHKTWSLFPLILSSYHNFWRKKTTHLC